MIQLPPSPPLDPWSSFDHDDQSPVSSQAGPSSRRSSPIAPQHPLYTSASPVFAQHERFNGLDVLSDVSRPALKRLTSETERQVAESSRSGSERGSLDLLRMSTADPGAEEVEVLVHQVKQGESIAGIALLYGIDVATLRKINKLWASDPVHLRTHLYVPLEACRWTKARDTFTRGPGDGQVTLTPKGAKDKGKGKEKAHEQDQPTKSLIDLDTPGAEKDFDAWEDSAKEFMPSTNLNYSRLSIDTARPSIDGALRQGEEEEEVPSRVLDIVRIPRSRLQFFPKTRPPEPRSSLDSPTRTVPRRSAGLVDEPRGPSIQNDLSTLPLPLQPRVPHPSKTNANKFVRLRPPNPPPHRPYASSSSPDTLVNRISNLFTVPPPPSSSELFAGRRASAGSLSFSRASSGSSTPVRSHVHQDEPLELRPRSSFDLPPSRRNGHHRSASASKKYD